MIADKGSTADPCHQSDARAVLSVAQRRVSLTLMDGSSAASSGSAAAATGEAALLNGLRAGDETAFERLVRTHTPRLLAVARRLLGNEEDARDAVQDAYVSAFGAIGRFKGKSKLATWLHRILVNAALLKLRARRRSKEQSIESLLPAFYEDGHRINPKPAWQATPQQLLERSETRQMVRRLIDELPDTYRTVLLMRDIEQMSTASTAELLEVSNAVVKTRLHRARQALRTLLESELL